ncbi:MAG: FAD/NAD(P)-binding protein [Firmicutes bacterium]|nr:FAD/NAD(P)-binding protein [Bacillota bacterium]
MSCSCHADPLVPVVAVVDNIRRDTADIKTFQVKKPEGGLPFIFKPGQCAMLSVPPLGEAIFSITSSPTQQEFLEFSIKNVGKVTDCLHQIEVGTEIGIRGPYGNNFPVEALRGKDLLFIGGGIGLAPLRSVINYALDNRSDYGKIDIVYGARSPEDFVHRNDLYQNWVEQADTDVHITVDREFEGWNGHVGFVPQYIEELNFSSDKTVLVCGPPIMIKFVLEVLEKLGFDQKQIYTTLELKMKCGIGKCGRCNIGDKYVCKDGPVFRCDELGKLPDEY